MQLEAFKNEKITSKLSNRRKTFFIEPVIAIRSHVQYVSDNNIITLIFTLSQFKSIVKYVTLESTNARDDGDSKERILGFRSLLYPSQMSEVDVFTACACT